MHRTSQLALILALGVVACQTGPTARRALADSSRPGALVAWTVGPLERISRTETPGAGRSFAIWCARGEFESFQVGIGGSGGALNAVTATISDFTGPSGAVIPATTATIYREHYVHVRHSSPDRQGSNRPLGPGWYPDALVPIFENGRILHGGAIAGAPFDVAPDTNQPLWIDVFVPPDALPGAYTATVNIASRQGTSSIPVSLHVWGFTLPARPSLKTSFGLHGRNTHDRNAQNLLLAHRISPTVADANAIRDLREAGLTCAALPLTSNASRKRCTMDPAPSNREVAATFAAYPHDVPLYVYVADEIDPCPNLIPTVLNWARTIRQVSPSIKTLATLTPSLALADDGTHTGRSAIDIWVVLPVMYDGHTEAIRRAIAKGDEVWSYNALVEDGYSPKWAIDYAPINYRIQPGFLNQQMQLTGLLYWSVDRFSASPWDDVESFRIDDHFFPGEGTLIYPGAQADYPGFVPSMRLKQLRDGVEDYEYIELLKAAGLRDWALQAAAPAGADWKLWTRDPNVLENVRKALGARLDMLAAVQARVQPSPLRRRASKARER